jgi:hypothetical protein
MLMAFPFDHTMLKGREARSLDDIVVRESVLSYSTVVFAFRPQRNNTTRTSGRGIGLGLAERYSIF